MKTKAILQFPIAMLAIIASACSDSEPAVSLSYQENAGITSNQSPYRTINDAISIAQNASKWLDEPNEAASRSAIRTIDFNNISTISISSKSRNGEADTLMYIVNFMDNEGFAIVSAKKSTPELIAVTQAGTYNAEYTSDNPGFNAYIEDAKKILSNARVITIDTANLIKPGGGLQPAIKEKTVIDTVWKKNIPYRAKVNWRESSEPEAKYCPNKHVGNGALAIAMGMLGLKHPQNIKMTHVEGQPTYALNWANMERHFYFKKGEMWCYKDQYDTHEHIALLCREVGFLGYAIYSDPLQTIMHESQTQTAITRLGFKAKNVTPITKYSVSNELTNNNVLIMYGETSNGTKHLWLCDGVKHFSTIENFYRSYDGGATWKHEGGPDYRPETAYNFYNWGWNGMYCGYYLDLNYIPKSDANFGFVDNQPNSDSSYSYNTGFFVMSK